MSDFSTGSSGLAASGGGIIVIRKARMADIPYLLRLVNDNAAQGIMLPRTEFEISENLRDFTVADSGDRLAGYAANIHHPPG